MVVESKAIIDDYGRSKITPTFNYRTVQAAFFYSNFLNRDMFAFFPKDKDGVFTGNYVGTEEVVNNKPMPLVDIPGDYGLWVRAVIEQKEVRDDPRPVLAQSDEMSISDAMKLLKQSTCFLSTWREISADVTNRNWTRIQDKCTYRGTIPSKSPSLHATIPGRRSDRLLESHV